MQRLMCGAWSALPRPGIGPGFTVTKRKRPSLSVAERPKPRKCGSSALACVSSGWSYRPAALACQISTSASGSGALSPSRTRPSMRILSPKALPPPVRSPHSGWSRPKRKKGPAVCDAVGMSRMSDAGRCRGATAQHDVEAITQRPFGDAEARLVAGDQPLARLGIGDAVEDGVVFQERVAGEEHLRDEPGGEGRAEHREMQVLGAPGVVGIAPRIGARDHRDEAELALVVADELAGAGEIGIERRVVLIRLMQV